MRTTSAAPLSTTNENTIHSTSAYYRHRLHLVVYLGNLRSFGTTIALALHALDEIMINPLEENDQRRACCSKCGSNARTAMVPSSASSSCSLSNSPNEQS